MRDNLGAEQVVERLQGFLFQIDDAEIVAHNADEPNAFVVYVFDSDPASTLEILTHFLS
jgi:hypothetical protein